MILSSMIEKQGNWLFRYRGFLPLVLLVAGYALFIYRGANPGNIYIIICLCISLFGFGIRIYTAGHAADGTSGRNTTSQIAESLNTTGAYSVTRNPLYLGNYFMWAGVALLTESILFFLLFTLVFWIYYERIIFAEEQFLIRKFGDSYMDWAAVTPLFIPNSRRFRKSVLPFNIKRVLKKEKDGLFALAAVFFIFDTTKRIEHDAASFINLYLLGFVIVSAILYGVLTYMKHNTELLD